MSNNSILLRLEVKLEDFLQQKMSCDEFTEYLINSVEALEAIDYEIIQEARSFQYKFEIVPFNDEYPEIESLEEVVINFKEWINSLKEK